ncbi:MAG: hypothetical protein EZS28_019505 [Streblomastix strix]|uniref:Uncharacterized protein n=1 Tax=Streblomastix strix TaxID=222440 RepID=A0A5J4VQM5_9EUKA|nr:MAG: hypothetical protein EZS28_019505 [Streblomastix strix]
MNHTGFVNPQLLGYNKSIAPNLILSPKTEEQITFFKFLRNQANLILKLSASGDFAFFAESGTVWMYESEWYDSGQLVPDQVTPASDELPIVNGTAAAGNSTSYSRGDHVHPQQLTYDGNVTATKFIKTGGLSSQILVVNSDSTTDFVTKTTVQSISGAKTFNNYITADRYKIPNGTSQQMLLANGSSKPLVLAEKDFYITGSIQYIKLCTFSAFTEPTDVSVEFTYNCRTGFGLIQFNYAYTSDGIGTYQYKLQPNMSYGMDVCYIIYFGTGADRYGELWARILMWSNYLSFQQTNQSQEIIPLNDVLSSEMQSQLPSGASSSTALIANNFNSVVHISSGLNDNRAGFTICLWNYATANNRGLRISDDGNTLTFNGRVI